MNKQPLLIQDAYDFGPPPPKAREAPWEKLYRFFFGDDVFISYSRADAIRYVPSLAARLAAKRHICFFDQLAADPSEDLPERLKKKILRSTVFIIVGTRGAVASSAVRKEVELFRHTRRPFIPLDVDGALVEQENWRDVIGTAKIREQGARVRAGDPSPEVVNLIKDSFRYTRRSQWLRASLLAGLGVILLTVALSLLVIRAAQAEATAIKRLAESEVAMANKKVGEAEQRLQIITAEGDRLKGEAADARKAADTAAAATETAIAQQKAAEQSMRQAQDLERQSAARAANTARREAGSRAALLADQPGMEAAALTLAVGAAEQGIARGGNIPDEVMDGITTSAMAADYSLPLEDVGATEAPLLLLISPDGSKILGAFPDTRTTSTRMVVWDGRTGKVTSDSSTPGGISAMAFSRDGKRLAALMVKKTGLGLDLWDVTGSRVRPLVSACGNNLDSIHKLALDSDGSYVIIDKAPNITICEIATGRERVLPGLQNIYGVAFTPEDEPAVYGAPLQSGGQPIVPFIYFPRSGQTVMPKSDGKAFDAGFVGFGDDSSLVTIARDYGAQQQDRVYVQSADGDVRRLTGYRGNVGSVTYVSGQVRAVTLSGRSVRVADARRLPNFAALRAHMRRLDVAAFSPDDKTVLTVSDDGKGRLWDVQSGRLRHVLPITDEVLTEDESPLLSLRNGFAGFRTAAFRADGKRLVTSNEKGEVQTWDADTGRPVCSEPGRRTGANDFLLSVSFLADGDYVLANYSRGSAEPPFIRFLDARTCVPVGTFNFDGHSSPLSISRDGTTIITAPFITRYVGYKEGWNDPDWDKPEMTLWSLRGLDLRSGAPIQLPSSSLGKPPGSFRGISPDGTRMLVASGDGMLQLWRPGEDSLVRLEKGRLYSPDYSPTAFAFSADGTHVAVVSHGEARVWDTRSGKLLVAFKCETAVNPFSSTALSSDGSKLLIGDDDHTVRIYPTSREAFLRVARRLLGR